MKRYNQPTTDMIAVELQQIMAGSLDAANGTGTVSESTVPDGTPGEARLFDFFTDPESAEKNEYPVYNLWED